MDSRRCKRCVKKNEECVVTGRNRACNSCWHIHKQCLYGGVMLMRGHPKKTPGSSSRSWDASDKPVVRRWRAVRAIIVSDSDESDNKLVTRAEMEHRFYDFEWKMEQRLKNAITRLDVDFGLISKHILWIDEAGYGREHGWKKTAVGETEWEEAHVEEDTGEVAEENKQMEEEQEKENKLLEDLELELEVEVEGFEVEEEEDLDCCVLEEAFPF